MKYATNARMIRIIPLFLAPIVLSFLVLIADRAPAFAQAIPGDSMGGIGTQPMVAANARRTQSAWAQDPGQFFSAPYGNQHFFGDWLGLQPWLVRHGIHIAADEHEELAGNFRGGAKQGVTDAGQTGVEIDIDWNRLAGLKNFWTHTMIVNGHGTNLSTEYIHDSLGGVQQIYGARGNVVAHLVYMYAEQSLFHNRLDISAGWIPVGSFFAASPLFCNFMNVSICGNPAPGKYVPGGRDWPSGNLGVVMRVMPTVDTYIMASMFAVSPHAYNGGISGWSWAQSGLGHFSTPVEIGWLPEFGRHHLAGHYKAGYGYDNSQYNDLFQDIDGNSAVITGRPFRKESGVSTAWFQADQMFVRNGKGPTNGLIGLAGYMYTSGKVSAMKQHAWAGMIETGAKWGRPLDTMGAMFHYFEMSRSSVLQQESSMLTGQPLLSNQWGQAWGIQTHEDVYELFYNIHAARGMSFQPDFQYINRPGGTTTYHDAAVMALQFNCIL
ncbi:carbohydrate porin [Gluconacetobacter entanii]|uniref:Carbohydrate porin n=1 Tax=Gluconacetobacter entanii TaxID=108528 RepID=A0ABT3K7U1_9PROT|nr:carbohydrate porin [Gluconacetobacter entanii]MBE7618381.1 carbohydrate porin [Komagataeibacter sp. FXV2]MCE2578532.1 carbohydrate porin [Komagataeibacter sp. FNDCR1]MCW4591483.1 carbohydrate porin [Gluconacetobacter entanii]MCW4593934.1 carbohydrate porin [Gluconacetobacter entanii]NPC88326.1 carbohydrate porin [Gluconacetobacter entanii]